MEKQNKMENTEYNEKIGTLAWAFQVAKEEGEVWHKGFKDKNNNYDDWKAIIYLEELVCEKYEGVCVNEFCLTGWYRKITPKEELIKKLAKVGAPRDTNEAYKIFMNVSEDYEVTKK